MDARRSRFWRGLRAAALGALGLFALYAVSLGLILPPLARHEAIDRLGETLGRKVAIDDLTVNPFTLEASLKGLRVFEPDGHTVFASFDALDLAANLNSLRHLAPVIDSATLRGLKVNLVREREEHYNASDIVARLAKPKTSSAGSKVDFSVSNIRLAGGRIDFDDRPLKARHEVRDLDLAIPFVSSLPVHAKDLVKPAISARVNGAPFHIEGEALPFEPSAAMHLAIDVKAIDLKRYAPYSPVALPVSIDSGELDARVNIRFENAKDQPAFRISGTAALRDLACSTPDAKPFIAVKRVDADLSELRPLARIVKLASVTVEGGEAALERSRDGSLRTVSMPVSDAAPASRPWNVTLARLQLSGFDVAFTDDAVRPVFRQRVRIERLEGADLSADHGGSGKLTAKISLEHGGTLDVASTVALDPFVAEARIDARSVDLAPLRPYVSQFPTVAIRKALASAKGVARVQGTGNAMRVNFTGAAAISDLPTLETASNEDLLNWHAAVARDIRFDWGPSAPLNVAMRDVVVDRAYSRIIVHPDGKLNVQQLRFADAPDPEAAHAAVAAAPKSIRIERIAFVGSRLNFTDHYVKPNYTADVGELEGVVAGLSSDPASRGTIELRGRYDRTSPVVIEGTVNPFAPDLFLDIAAKGSDIELPKLSTYSQRYAGYGIREGKLSLDVRYHLEGGKLEGRNKILLEQLTFGDKVESPDAIKLPILFAVNLLKDANGRIDLELPVSGSLDDPQFEVSGLIGQVVTTLLKKAVTSPFEFLSAVFSGGSKAPGDSKDASGAKPASGKDLAFVDFDPGRAEISDGGRGKLERLAQVLRERPGLKLEVASRLDEDRELRALRFAALRREVAEAKRRAAGGQGEITVEDAEYPKYVRAAYANAKLPEGDWSLATMEERLIEQAAIDPETLKQLATNRADRVMKFLTAEGQLPAERIQLASAVDEVQGKDAASRVVFALR